jgi:hypothetical protein
VAATQTGVAAVEEPAGVTALSFALVTFICTLGLALLGMSVRAVLPATHLSKESVDVIRLGMGLVATMTALLLGLVTAAAKGSFDSQEVAVRNAAAGVLTLDRLLARYGPEAEPIRERLRQIVAVRVESTWPVNGDEQMAADNSEGALAGAFPAEEIENRILQLSVDTESRRWFKAESLKLTEEVLRARWRLLGSAGGSVPRVFLAVVLFWLAMTFGSFGLNAPPNATVVTVFVIAALSVAAAMFLILELDGPLDGVIKISSAPFRHALANLGR